MTVEKGRDLKEEIKVFPTLSVNWL